VQTWWKSVKKRKESDTALQVIALAGRGRRLAPEILAGEGGGASSVDPPQAPTERKPGRRSGLSKVVENDDDEAPAAVQRRRVRTALRHRTFSLCSSSSPEAPLAVLPGVKESTRSKRKLSTSTVVATARHPDVEEDAETERMEDWRKRSRRRSGKGRATSAAGTKRTKRLDCTSYEPKVGSSRPVQLPLPFFENLVGVDESPAFVRLRKERVKSRVQSEGYEGRSQGNRKRRTRSQTSAIKALERFVLRKLNCCM
jgi:hypothetical protein